MVPYTDWGSWDEEKDNSHMKTTLPYNHLSPIYQWVKEVGRKKKRGGKKRRQHHNHTGLLEVKNNYTYSWEKKQWSSVYDYKETLKSEDAIASCNIQAGREQLALSELLGAWGSSNEEYLMLPLKIPYWQETHISSVDLKQTEMWYQSIQQVAVYFSDWILGLPHSLLLM